MDSSRPSPELLARWRGGDQAAAQSLFQQYALRLTRLADQYLSQKLAGRVDGEDIVQSVFRTFFQRSARGEFQIDDSIDLWQLLVHITLAKVRSESRRHTAERRDIGREVSVADDQWLPQALAREPGPEEAAILVDQIEWLLDGLPDDYGQILALRLAGHSRTKIARLVGVSRQTVSRALSLIEQRMQRLLPTLNEP